MINEIIPSEDQHKKINDLLGNYDNHIAIWDMYITQAGETGTVFKKGEPILFNVCCAISDIIFQLKPEMLLHIFTHDIIRFCPQPLYECSVKIDKYYQFFKFVHAVDPAVSGFFKYSAILEIEKTNIFWHKQGSVFKIK